MMPFRGMKRPLQIWKHREHMSNGHKTAALILSSLLAEHTAAVTAQSITVLSKDLTGVPAGISMIP